VIAPETLHAIGYCPYMAALRPAHRQSAFADPAEPYQWRQA